MAVTGSHWVVSIDDMETIQPVDGLWEYYASVDTTVNDIHYTKILHRPLVIKQDGPPFQADGPYQLYGLIRDDNANRKVYAIKFNDSEECPENEEYLLYDFSLKIGDTLNLCIIPDWNDFVINDIYSQEVLGFNTRVYFDWDELYEGMGSYYGLFEEMFAPIKKTSGQRYIYHTFLAYYCRESPCWLFVSAPEQLESETITISPNPANDFIYISGCKTEIRLISIYNKLGQKMVVQNPVCDKINISELPPGLYIIEIDMKANKIKQKVIIH